MTTVRRPKPSESLDAAVLVGLVWAVSVWLPARGTQLIAVNGQASLSHADTAS
jgi:hypothetical protein